LPATSGKVGIFGGPKDRGIKPDDKLALPTGPHGVYERVRSLNPKSFYCSMRWNYHVEHLTPEEVKRSWANKKILVTNSKHRTRYWYLTRRRRSSRGRSGRRGIHLSG
jgi:hypothetical protein